MLIKNDFDKVFEFYDVVVGLIVFIIVFNIGEEIDDFLIMYVNDLLIILVNFVGLFGILVFCG